MSRVRSPRVFVVAFLLVALMAVGSILLWIGIPIFWLWFASRLVNSSQPTFGPYVLILVGIPASMFIVGKLLARLNAVYGDVTQTTSRVRVPMPWLRSMRGERESGRPRTILDVVMVCSVALALIAMAVWFFVFAGSSLPT